MITTWWSTCVPERNRFIQWSLTRDHRRHRARCSSHQTNSPGIFQQWWPILQAWMNSSEGSLGSRIPDFLLAHPPFLRISGGFLAPGLQFSSCFGRVSGFLGLVLCPKLSVIALVVALNSSTIPSSKVWPKKQLCQIETEREETNIHHHRGTSFSFFGVCGLYGVYPSFRTYGVYVFPLFSQGNRIHHSFFALWPRGRATDRERRGSRQH